MILTAPLSVQTARQTRFAINLNIFRNSHYHTLYKAKVNYKAIMSEQILKLPKMESISLKFTLYPQTNRRMDLDNMLSIQCKFFADAMVELQRLPDDDYLHITGVAFAFGEIDPENQRVEIEVINNE